MSLPQTLNGYPVVSATGHGNGYATVMVDRGPDSPHQFVVATWHDGLKTGWLWGHYEGKREDADKTFAEISERNAKRSA